MRLLCLLLLTFFAAPAAASPICVAGRLAETGSGKAIDFAEIYLFTGGNVRPARQTLPDEQGGFRLDSVDPGAYTLMIRLIGYDVLTREVALEHSAGTVDLGVLYLTPLENGIAEVEVVAARKQLVYKLDKKVVDASSNIMGGGGSAVDILENTPSVRGDAEASPACFPVRRRSNRFPPGISRTSKSLRLRRRGTTRRAMWALSTSLPKSIRNAGSAAR